MPAQINEREVRVTAGEHELEGALALPPGVRGVVLFAHGSGSSRNSPRNRAVAAVLQDAGLATLLFDLLTAQEEAVDEATAQLRFDIGLLARRLVAATDWVAAQAATKTWRRTTSAPARAAAVPEVVRAVVSRAADQTSRARRCRASKRRRCASSPPTMRR